MKGEWAPERIEQLKSMIAAGVGYAQIGRSMGLSKNAVLGKAHRLGYGTPKPQPVEPPRAKFPDRGRCVYPIGHPKDDDFRFCGKSVRKEGEPYCEKHHDICLVPANANALKQINFAAANLGKVG